MFVHKGRLCRLVFAAALAIFLVASLGAHRSGGAPQAAASVDASPVATPLAGCSVAPMMRSGADVASPEPLPGAVIELGPLDGASPGEASVMVEPPGPMNPGVTVTVGGVTFVDLYGTLGSSPASGSRYDTPEYRDFVVGRVATEDEWTAVERFLGLVSACSAAADRERARALFTPFGLRHLLSPGDPLGAVDTPFGWVVSEDGEPDRAYFPMQVADIRVLPTGHVSVAIFDRPGPQTERDAFSGSLWLLAPTPDGLRVDLLIDIGIIAGVNPCLNMDCVPLEVP